MIKLTTVIPAVFNQIRPGATFMSVCGYKNNFGEISNFGLVFHANYYSAIKKALNIWLAYSPKTPEEIAAKKALFNSYRTTLTTGHNPYALSAHAYSPIVDKSDNLIKGVKWYDNGREVHLWGFRIAKRILVPGKYPPSAAWDTDKIARHNLLSMTPLINFRQFKLIEGRFSSIGVEKLTLTHHQLLEELV